MLCSRFKQVLSTKTIFNNNIQFRCYVNARFLLKKYGVNGIKGSYIKNGRELRKMNSLRYIFRDIRVNKLWNTWSRSTIIGNVMRRYRKDKGVREVIHCFRQAFSRPRRTLLLSATAACKASEYSKKKPSKCSRDITDEDLEALVLDLDGVDELAKKTLYCSNCSKRMIIDKKYPDIKYCPCKDSKPPDVSVDGWVPYMEAEDTIIWRKEYKPGGLYAYKVYGRYKEVNAQDYADVNVDGAYRKVWDNAVAALSVVERSANGVLDQTVIHWEVLWPRLFANRDYVYIRRHKEYTVKSAKSPQLFDDPTPLPIYKEQRSSVHSRAKQKSIENYSKEANISDKTNKVFVIISRSCTHPDVPESRNAIRVTEYWSHMVVRTIDGVDKPGMEFVLTYYDEPAVGGLPSGVAAWATGRAAPAYLQRMRLAAKDYTSYKKLHKKEMPDFTPFRPDTMRISYEEQELEDVDRIKEEDMESSKTGPDMENGHTRDTSTQTEETHPPIEDKVTKDKVAEDTKNKLTEDKVTKDEVAEDTKDKLTEDKVTKDKVGEDTKDILTEDNVTKEIVTSDEITEDETTKDETDKDEIDKDETTKDEVTEDKVAKEKSKEEDKAIIGVIYAKDVEEALNNNSEDSDKNDIEKNSAEEDPNKNGRWWHYLHPYYYFV